MGKKQDKSAKGTIKPAASMTMGSVSRLKEFFYRMVGALHLKIELRNFYSLVHTFWNFISQKN